MGDSTTVELRAVGPHVQVFLDQELVATAQDPAPMAGAPYFYYVGNQESRLDRLEVLNLDGLPEADALKLAGVSSSPSLPVSSSTPATATKDAPFVNSLGMKFVPVPITGGPTDGKRVLFSIWETRNQDFTEFARARSLPWHPPGGGDMETVAKNNPTTPAALVSWEEATAFCAWLTERERQLGRLGAGEAYRLPSDHEWSCAVGIGGQEEATKLPTEKNDRIPDVYPWGTAWPPPPGAANLADESLHRSPGNAARVYLQGYDDGFAFLSPVGSFPPNALGLHDLSGNVEEFCTDFFDAGKNRRTTRGNGWQGSGGTSSAHRVSIAPDYKGPSVGFRVVLAPVEGAK